MKNTPLNTKIAILSAIPSDYATDESLGLVEFCEENDVLFNLCESVESGDAELTEQGKESVEYLFDELCLRFGITEDIAWKSYDEFISAK